MKKLATGGLGTGAGTLLYTVPKGYRADVMDICIANTTAAGLTCTLHLVASGGSPATTNQMFPAMAVPANTMIHWSGVETLNAGDFIQGIGSGSGITVHVTGDEQSVSR